jgi:predicted HicB family RNase H-like nuclease
MDNLKQMLIRIPVSLHEKLRYKAYLDHKSITGIIVEILEKALKDIEPPEKK